MLGQVLKFGSSLDWITPTIALFNDFRNGSVVIFFVPFGVGWSAVDVKRMLESKGVRVWGLMIADDQIKFRVREAQARYTAYWLERHHLPFESSTSFAKSKGASGSASDRGSDARSAPTEGAGQGTKKKGGMIDGMLDGIDGVVDRL